MGRIITKRQILDERVLAMDMDTYKKNKGALSDEDKVKIIDKDSENNMNEEILDENDEPTKEEFE